MPQPRPYPDMFKPVHYEAGRTACNRVIGTRLKSLHVIQCFLLLTSVLGKWSTGQAVPVNTLAEDEDLTVPHIVADKADLFLAYATVPGYR